MSNTKRVFRATKGLRGFFTRKVSVVFCFVSVSRFGLCGGHRGWWVRPGLRAAVFPRRVGGVWAVGVAPPLRGGRAEGVAGGFFITRPKAIKYVCGRIAANCINSYQTVSALAQFCST